MGNADGEFVITKDEAEAAVYAASGLYSFGYVQGNVVFPVVSQLTFNNPKRIYLLFSNISTVDIIINNDGTTTSSSFYLAAKTNWALKYSEVGSWVQQAFFARVAAGTGVIAYTQVYVI